MFIHKNHPRRVVLPFMSGPRSIAFKMFWQIEVATPSNRASRWNIRRDIFGRCSNNFHAYIHVGGAVTAHRSQGLADTRQHVLPRDRFSPLLPSLPPRACALRANFTSFPPTTNDKPLEWIPPLGRVYIRGITLLPPITVMLFMLNTTDLRDLSSNTGNSGWMMRLESWGY